MDEPLATDAEIEFSVTPETVFELDESWVTFLENEPLAALIEGADPDLLYLPDSATGSATAHA